MTHRHLLCWLFACIIGITTVNAQSGPYGNEWIKFDQTYYRIPVTQRGLYRLTTEQLKQAGLPVSTLDPTTLQLFRRGVEQAITVVGEGDKRLDAEDYLEFIGEGNDGTQDSLLYSPRNSQPHSYYSMFSDTAAYFLTWRKDGGAGKRMTFFTEPSTTGLSPEPYHLATQRLVFTQEYSFKDIMPFSTRHEVFFEQGEGWTGVTQNKGVSFSQTILLNGWVRNAPEQPQLEILLNGRDNTSHLVDIRLGAGRRQAGTVSFTLFQTPRFRTSLGPADVSATGELTIETVSRGPEPFDRYSVSYIQVRYPQTFEWSTGTQRSFELLPRTGGRSLLELANTPESLFVYDVTDPTNPRRLADLRNGTGHQVVVTGTEISRRIWATSSVTTPVRLERVVFRKLDAAKSNYLVVSHENLMKKVGNIPDAVRAFAGYRASAAGGGYDTLVVTFRELVNQFSYGERTSLAIRRFADYMLTSVPEANRRDKYLLLLGRGNIFFATRQNPNQYNLDLVPSLAYMPGSDVSLTAGLANYPTYLNAMPTGRINTLNPQEILNYLAKVQEFERLPANAPWRKEVLHLSGGRSAFEITTFRTIMDAAGRVAKDQFLGATITTRSKKTDEPVERVDVTDIVNKGVGMITLFGHSSPIVTDTDLGYASNLSRGYQNKGRYPFLFFNGCGIGNIFFGATNNLSTDWVMTPDRGAIASLAHGFSGYVGQLDNFTRVLYETQLGDTLFLTQPIGLVHRETSRRVLQRYPNELDISNVQHMILEGDPAVRLYAIPRADFQLVPDGITVIGNQTSRDSVSLQVVLTNAGRFNRNERPALAVRQRQSSGMFQPILTLPGRALAFRDTVKLAFRAPASEGRTSYELTIDAENRIAELDESNNSFGFEIAQTANTLTVELPQSGQRFPPDRQNPLLDVSFDGVRLPDGAVIGANPTVEISLLDEDRYRIRQDTVGIELLIKKPCAGCQYERVWLGGPQVKWQPAGADNRFVLTYRPGPLANGVHSFQVLAADVAGNKAGLQPYQIQFRVKNEDSVSVIRSTPNPFRFSTVLQFTLTGKEPNGELQAVIRDVKGLVVRWFRQPVRTGENSIFWDGTTQNGALLPAGMYLFQMQLPDGQRRETRLLLVP